MALTGLLVVGCVACESQKKQAPDAVSPEQGATTPPENEPRPGSFVLESLEHEVVSSTPSEIAFLVKPGKGLKINPAYPWKFTIEEPDAEGVTLGQEAILKKDAMSINASQASIPVKLTAASDGEFELQGSLNLSVCEKGDEARCLWFTDEPVTLKVKAKSAQK